MLEAGNHWFKTYHLHHVEKLYMTQSTFDPCLLHTHQDPHFGIAGLQTDDTLFLGNQSFADLEHKELHNAKLLAKDREQLTPDHSLKFNGGII